jgi:predicted metal-dependent hydrolase
MSHLRIDDLDFEVRRSPRRSTVQITVERDGKLLLCAPESCSEKAMARFILEKRYWIYTKLAQKDALRATVPTKRYVNGEGFAYLGRSHRLLLVRGQDTPVKLEQGRFKMDHACAAEGRQHMLRWYTQRALPWLRKRVDAYTGRVGAVPVDVNVQDLGFRWGSCSNAGRVNFHWRTILLPPRAIDYVVVHELVHLVEPHHTRDFWRRVERVLPDYDARKQWLSEKGDAASAV